MKRKKLVSILCSLLLLLCLGSMVFASATDDAACNHQYELFTVGGGVFLMRCVYCGDIVISPYCAPAP